MSSYNKVILMGNLTRDPETRTAPSGAVIARFGMAVSRTYQTKDGERKEEVTFVDVTAFGRQAEVIQKYFTKGKPIFFEGRLKFDQWETNAGQKRSKLSVVLEQFQFIGGNREGSAGASGSASTDAPGDEPLDEEPPF